MSSLRLVWIAGLLLVVAALAVLLLDDGERKPAPDAAAGGIIGLNRFIPAPPCFGSTSPDTLLGEAGSLHDLDQNPRAGRCRKDFR